MRTQSEKAAICKAKRKILEEINPAYNFRLSAIRIVKKK